MVMRCLRIEQHSHRGLLSPACPRHCGRSRWGTPTMALALSVEVRPRRPASGYGATARRLRRSRAEDSMAASRRRSGQPDRPGAGGMAEFDRMRIAAGTAQPRCAGRRSSPAWCRYVAVRMQTPRQFRPTFGCYFAGFAPADAQCPAAPATAAPLCWPTRWRSDRFHRGSRDGPRLAGGPAERDPNRIGVMGQSYGGCGGARCGHAASGCLESRGELLRHRRFRDAAGAHVPVAARPCARDTAFRARMTKVPEDLAHPPHRPRGGADAAAAR